MEIGVIIAGILLGLGAAVPIGPVNVLIIRRCLEYGFWSGVSLGCGAVTVDVVYAVAAAMGARAVGDSPWVFWPVSVCGIALLGWLAYLCLSGARTDYRRDIQPAPAEGSKPFKHRATGYVTGLGMTAANPMTLGFWFVAMPNTAMNVGGQDASGLPAMCLGVFIATLGWVLVLSGIMAGLGRWRKAWWLAAASEMGGAILLVFAVLAFVRCASHLL